MGIRGADDATIEEVIVDVVGDFEEAVKVAGQAVEVEEEEHDGVAKVQRGDVGTNDAAVEEGDEKVLEEVVARVEDGREDGGVGKVYLSCCGQ